MDSGEFGDPGWPRSPVGSEIGDTMPHVAFGSWTLRSIAGLVLMTVGAVGTHDFKEKANRHSPPAVESSDCHGNHDDDRDGGRDHDHDGRDNKGRGKDGHGKRAGSVVRQMITVHVPATTFLRVDRSGRVTSAATNTGCQPSNSDDVFLFRPGGTIETTAIDVDTCNWTGNFSVPGRFQPQTCRPLQHDR